MKKIIGYFVVLGLLVMTEAIWSDSGSEPNAPSASTSTNGPETASAPASPNEPEAPAALSATLEALLDKIEQRGSTLKSFQAQMDFRQEQTLLDVLEIRKGQLLYQVQKDQVRFLIHFDNWQQIDLEEEEPSPAVAFDEDFSFDGQWLTRRHARNKMLQKWEVSKETNTKETFRLGKGPFPLPFALKKADVVREFEVELLPSATGDPEKTDHLLLRPKKDSSFAEEYLKLELWISQLTTVPVQLRFERDDHEVTTIAWSKIQIDKEIDPKKFTLKPAGEDWTVEVTPLEEKKVKQD